MHSDFPQRISIDLPATYQGQVHIHLANDAAKHYEILAAIANLKTHLGALIMTSKQDIMQNVSDMHDLFGQVLDLTVAADARAAEAETKRQAAVDALNISEAEKTQLKADLTEIFNDTVAKENDERSRIPGLPPVGTPPLASSYVDRASFDTAVAAYQGPEGVTIDGQPTSKTGTPNIDYFTHSADGHIDTTGPTD